MDLKNISTLVRTSSADARPSAAADYQSIKICQLSISFLHLQITK